jgi:D-lactate dehydrogenase (cytochrome)
MRQRTRGCLVPGLCSAFPTSGRSTPVSTLLGQGRASTNTSSSSSSWNGMGLSSGLKRLEQTRQCYATTLPRRGRLTSSGGRWWGVSASIGLVVLPLSVYLAYKQTVQAEQTSDTFEAAAAWKELFGVKEQTTKLPAGLVAQLSALLNSSTGEQRFVVEYAERENHAKDPSYHEKGLPDAVAFPRNTEEVQEIVKACNYYKTPIIPYGSGTSLEGHTIANRGGICIDFRYMNKVVQLHVDDMDVVVQPGIKREDLNAYLEPHGLFFPLDPGPGASIGGMVGTNCSGTHAVRYGTMKENIMSLKAVLANGDLVTTGRRSKKTSAGYDLTHLLVGSEGTLAVTVEITLRLKRLPEKTAVAVCEFGSVKDAANTVIQAMQTGIQIGRVELLDDVMMKGVNAGTGRNEAETPTLFFEFSGSPAQVEEQERVMRRLAEKNGGQNFRFAEGEESQELWSARKNAYWNAQALRPGADVMTTDVCVPISKLADCIDATKQDLLQSSIIAPIVGHVGDGNFHLVLLFDAQNEDEVKEANSLCDRLVERALAMEGTCTGEHGVGTGKMKWLEKELGPEAVAMMRTIKKALDPNNIMNPGKVINV